MKAEESLLKGTPERRVLLDKLLSFSVQAGSLIFFSSTPVLLSWDPNQDGASNSWSHHYSERKHRISTA